jgi:hypothetical protein
MSPWFIAAVMLIICRAVPFCCFFICLEGHHMTEIATLVECQENSACDRNLDFHQTQG